MANSAAFSRNFFALWQNLGPFWLAVAFVSAGVFFVGGLESLSTAWALPEYSHGPLIPVLSALLFLRQLKEYPIDARPKHHRWVGIVVIIGAIGMGAVVHPQLTSRMPPIRTIDQKGSV